MKFKKQNSPKISKYILSIFLNHSHPETMIGDYEEMYFEIIRKKGILTAKLWFWLQIFLIIPPSIKNSVHWSATMLKNYLTIVFRNLKKQKVFSFINIAGLGMGIACCILVFFFVHDELSYDRFHENVDNIYELKSILYEGNSEYYVDAHPSLGPTLPDQFPEILQSARINQENLVVKYKDKIFQEKGLSADPSFFKIFTFPPKLGHQESALKEHHSVIITDKFAQKYFDNENPIGKSISIQINDEYQEFFVSGVVDNAPINSSLQFNFIININVVYGEMLNEWAEDNIRFLPLFILLSDQHDPQDLAAKFPETIDIHFRKKFNEKSGYHLYPVADYHLYSSRDSHVFDNKSKIIYSYIFSGIALLVLLIACFNFTNLTIGRASARLKEIGMRKVLGAQRRQLAKQFWFESVVLSILALIVGIFLANFFLPIFNQYSQKNLDMDFLNSGWPILFLILLTIFVGIIAGSYPSFFLSRFSSIEIFRAKLKVSGKNLLSRILIILQFSISIFLIIVTIFFYRQNQYLLQKDLGFIADQVIVIPFDNLPKDNQKNQTIFQSFKNRLISYDAIQSVSGSSYPLTNYWSAAGPKLLDGRRILIDINYVDIDYIKTLKMSLIDGRDFSKDFTSDLTNAIIVNEAFVKKLQIESPIDKPASDYFAEKNYESLSGKIIGVMKDIHYTSLHEEIQPALLRLVTEENYKNAYVKIKGKDIEETIKIIAKELKNTAPNIPFSYYFLDEKVAQQYAAETRWSKMVNYASSFAILIAASGLFGLTLLVVVRRTKEIGIRKVLGASVPNIMKLINNEFVWLVLLANIFAWPAAYYVMDMFFQNYAYHVPLDLWVFGLSGLLAFLIAIITVSINSLKAANANPINTIKYE